jgi:hypothetical protein
MAAFKKGSKVRSKTSGIVGKITEIIEIEHGHQIVPPVPGTNPGEGISEYEPRTDLRIEYTDDAGNTAEHLIHATDAEAA